MDLQMRCSQIVQIALLPRYTALLDISVMPRCRPVNSGEAQPLRCSILPDTHAQAASPMAVKDRGKIVSFKKTSFRGRSLFG